MILRPLPASMYRRLKYRTIVPQIKLNYPLATSYLHPNLCDISAQQKFLRHTPHTCSTALRGYQGGDTTEGSFLLTTCMHLSQASDQRILDRLLVFLGSFRLGIVSLSMAINWTPIEWKRGQDRKWDRKSMTALIKKRKSSCILCLSCGSPTACNPCIRPGVAIAMIHTVDV